MSKCFLSTQHYISAFRGVTGWVFGEGQYLKIRTKIAGLVDWLVQVENVLMKF